MPRLTAVLGTLAALLGSMAFAGLNGGQRVTLRLGVATFYRVPLPFIVFGALILGMLVMLVAGVVSDLRVRRILRERLAQEDLEERARFAADRYQTSLFDDDDTAADPTERRRGPVENRATGDGPADTGER